MEKIKNKLKSLKNMLNEIKKTRTTSRTRNKWNKNETKRKLNMLDDEINDILEQLDGDLTNLRLKCEFFWKILWIQFH